MNHFASFLRLQMGSLEQREFAARLGISPSQLSKILAGEPCKRDTVAKIAAGVSLEPRVRARCVAALLNDYAILAGDAAYLIHIKVK